MEHYHEIAGKAEDFVDETSDSRLAASSGMTHLSNLLFVIGGLGLFLKFHFSL